VIDGLSALGRRGDLQARIPFPILLSAILSTREKFSALFERTSDDAIFLIYLALSTSD
jgi:hypothetical protein